MLPEGWPALVHPAVAPAGYSGPVTVITLGGSTENVREAVVIDESGEAIPAGPVTVSGRNVSFELLAALPPGEYRVVLNGDTGPVAEGSMTVGPGPELEVTTEFRPPTWSINLRTKGMTFGNAELWAIPVSGQGQVAMVISNGAESDEYCLGVDVAVFLGDHVFVLRTVDTAMTAEVTFDVDPDTWLRAVFYGTDLPIDPGYMAVPFELTDRSDPSGSADPVDSDDPAGSVDPVDSAESTDLIDPANAPESADSADPGELTNSAGADLFSDVPADHWARADLEAMAARNIVHGDEVGRFNSESAVTRTEFAALLVRTLELEPVTPARPTFTDVAPTDWFYPDVETAAGAGLIQGFAGAFRPQDRISRQEMAVILARGLRERDAAPSLAAETAEALLAGLADRADIAVWAEADVALVYHLGLVEGRTEATYAPLVDATRLEAVVGLKRLLEELGEM